jgi:hypothetical protein
MSKVSRGPKSVKPKSIYRVKNWSSYNRALIARGSLTLWLDASVWSSWYYEGPPQRGAQYTYSDQAIEYESRCEICNLCESLDIDRGSEVYMAMVAERRKHRIERRKRKEEHALAKSLGTVVIEIDEVDSCDDVDTKTIEEGITEDLLAASENIGQEPLAITTYCQENDRGPAAGGNAPEKLRVMGEGGKAEFRKKRWLRCRLG